LYSLRWITHTLVMPSLLDT